MSALVQGFTQYESLEKYLNVCFSLVVLKQKKEIPKCFIRNDVNHFSFDMSMEDCKELSVS